MTNLINKSNVTLNLMNDNIVKATNNSNNAVKNALIVINDALIAEGMKTDKLLTRVVKRELKAVIMKGVEDAQNAKLTRAYNVAFTIVFRGLKIHTSSLSLAQIENLCKHGAKKEINEYATLMISSEEYKSDIADYLKTLKTRKTTVMTFKRTAK